MRHCDQDAHLIAEPKVSYSYYVTINRDLRASSMDHHYKMRQYRSR